MILPFKRKLLSVDDDGRGCFDVAELELAAELRGAVPGRAFRIRCDGDRGEVVFSDEHLNADEKSACEQCLQAHQAAAVAT